MDIGKSLTFLFEDPNWVAKVLIGSVILLVSIPFMFILVGFVGFAIVAGYGLETLRNVREGVQYPMPEWKDRWGEWLVLGLKLLVALLVWILPALLVGLFMVVGAAFTGSESEGLQAFGGLILVCFGCVVTLWSIAVYLASPVIYIRLAETEKLSSAFQFADILAFTRDHVGQVIIISIVYLIASFVVGSLASMLGLLLCGIGLVITVPAGQFITTLIQSHLYAQIGLPPAEESQELQPTGA